MLRKDNTQPTESIRVIESECGNTSTPSIHRHLMEKQMGNLRRLKPASKNIKSFQESLVTRSTFNSVFGWIKFGNRDIPPKDFMSLKGNDRKGLLPINNCISLNRTGKRRDNIEYRLSRYLPQRLQQDEWIIENMDKVFSGVWLDEIRIVLGTKCQKLIVLDTNTNDKVVIPNFIQSVLSPSVDQERNFFNPLCSGIHSIAINPSRTLLAVGIGLPSIGIQIYRLPMFDPVSILEGHEDLIFSVAWLDDNTLISGSKDKSLRTWKLDEEFLLSTSEECMPCSVSIFQPKASAVQHGQKVRALSFDKDTSDIFTLSADGSVKIWDANHSIVHSTVELYHKNETVCLGLDPQEHMVSVGSQGHCSIIDPRIGKVVNVFESLDEGWGVRSMVIQNNLMTIGGGLGRLSFYDMRSNRYLDWDSNKMKGQDYLQSGDGWLCKDAIYNRHFQGAHVNNAIYALAYDSGHSRLFTAGGPLQLNLKGTYAAIWQ